MRHEMIGECLQERDPWERLSGDIVRESMVVTPKQNGMLVNNLQSKVSKPHKDNPHLLHQGLFSVQDFQFLELCFIYSFEDIFNRIQRRRVLYTGQRLVDCVMNDAANLEHLQCRVLFIGKYQIGRGAGRKSDEDIIINP
ncbi:hypothetical protein YC2023_030895 [Brassica napus]